MTISTSATCPCCGEYNTTSGGCLKCTWQRTFCMCGALLACGCGRTFEHVRCPNVILVRTSP